MPGFSPIIPRPSPAAAVLTFPRFTATSELVAAGGTWSASLPWDDLTVDGAVPIRQVGLTSDPPTEAHLRILRRSAFDEEGLARHVAFEAHQIGEEWEREYLWDYEDEDQSGRVHVHITNTGLAASTFTLTLNHRDLEEET